MKIILVYIFLVGILLIGLLGILRVGEKLTPPENISGDWVIDTTFTNGVERNNAFITFTDKAPKLSIEQSGVYIKAAFNDSAGTMMNGRIVDDSLLIDETLRLKGPGEISIMNTYEIKFAVKISREKGPVKKLSGKCRISGGARPVDLKFVAVKE